MTDFVYCDTPIGRFQLQGNGSAVTAMDFAEGEAAEEAPGYLQSAKNQVLEYFAGTRRNFDFPIAPQGTPFQKMVWDALRTIPYGQTVTYGEIADRIGKRKAARAVGAAAGRNPCLLAIPCHRLVGTRGLTGFAAGLERKAFLLELEQKGHEDSSKKIPDYPGL